MESTLIRLVGVKSARSQEKKTTREQIKVLDMEEAFGE
jgi:hypothetical protein